VVRKSIGAALLSQGTHGTGTRKYTVWQQRDVRALVAKATKKGKPITVQQISTQTKLSGNTIRAILSDGDGEIFLLGGNGARGYVFVTDHLGDDDGSRYTERLEAQILTMQARVAARKHYAMKMQRAATKATENTVRAIRPPALSEATKINHCVGRCIGLCTCTTLVP
jgi:hypothetical protein